MNNNTGPDNEASLKAVFGERLSALRKKKKYSQEKLAELFEISRESISKYEHGKALPGLDLLRQLSIEFNCSYDHLMGKDEYLKPQYRDIEKMLGLSVDSIIALEQLSLVKDSIFAGRSDLIDTINLLLEHIGYTEHTRENNTIVCTGGAVAPGLVNKINEYLLFDVDTATYSVQNLMAGKKLTSHTAIDADTVSKLFIMEINEQLVELRQKCVGRRSRAHKEYDKNREGVDQKESKGENA